MSGEKGMYQLKREPSVAAEDWTKRAACREQIKFLTWRMSERWPFCSTCPVVTACRRSGMYGMDEMLHPAPPEKPQPKFGCGHLKTDDNSHSNGVDAYGKPRTACRICRSRRYRAKAQQSA